ncbi:MAG: CopD family protein [Hyphomicrobiales bacterium]|nr:CopD family protein [Hyphomicrobiales bacterium]
MNARGRFGAPLIALLIALAPASEACAHASLVKAVPADGAVMPLPPAALTLTFNEPVSPLVVRLIGPDGAPLVPIAVTAQDTTVTISAPPALRRGTHVLSWRVISADGHPVGGSLMFSIGARSPAAQPENLADRGVRAALWAARVVMYLALFVGAGGAFFAAWIADGAARRAWIVIVLAAGLVAVALSVGLQGLDALELPLSGLQHKLAWEAGLATSYGATAVAAALALLAAVFGSVAKSASTARGLSLVGVIGAGLALSLSGHASTAAPQLLNRPAVFLHVVCVAFWIGSLLPLCLALRSARTRGPHAVGAQLERFSHAIPLVIVLLVASGLWLAFVQLDRIAALWTTSYGQLLACKLACVVVLLALAAANRYRLVPKFEIGGAAAARPLTTAIAFELAIALLILSLVALWRFTPPPRALAVAAPISLHLHGEKAMAEIAIERNGKVAAASVLLLDGAFQPLAAKEVTLVLANPAAGIEPMRRIARRAGETNWRIEDLRIPVAGRWTLGVEILISDFDKVTVEDTVALPSLP